VRSAGSRVNDAALLRAKALMDTEVVREREAWYKAGAGAVAMYSSIGVLAISVVTGLVSAIWHFVAASVGGATPLAWGFYRRAMSRPAAKCMWIGIRESNVQPDLR
jgi:hypothetical protein